MARLKNDSYEKGAVLNWAQFVYCIPFGQVCDIPGRMGDQMLKRYPELKIVEDEEPTCSPSPSSSLATANEEKKVEEVSDNSDGDETEKVDLMPGVSAPVRGRGRPRKGA